MLSATLHPAVIDVYNELSEGRVAGPFSMPLLPQIHVSHFGSIPKKIKH